MKKSSSRLAWQLFIPLLCIACMVAGIALGVRSQINVLSSVSGVRVNSITYQIALISMFCVIVWGITKVLARRELMKLRKELARKSIKRTYDLLKITSRTLDNLDMKANTILHSNANPMLEKALVHEFLLNVRNQVVEVYNGASMCIEDWREILVDEFDEIEKKERLLDKIVLEQMLKAQRLKEYERDKSQNHEKELITIKADLARLAEKKRMMQSEIISEARKLIGAPITAAQDIVRPLPPNPKIDYPLKHPMSLHERDARDDML